MLLPNKIENTPFLRVDIEIKKWFSIKFLGIHIFKMSYFSCYRHAFKNNGQLLPRGGKLGFALLNYLDVSLKRTSSKFYEFLIARILLEYLYVYLFFIEKNLLISASFPIAIHFLSILTVPSNPVVGKVTVTSLFRHVTRYSSTMTTTASRRCL
jgi:hypothetical protein